MKREKIDKNNMILVNNNKVVIDVENTKDFNDCTSFVIVTRDKEVLEKSLDAITTICKKHNKENVNVFIFGTYEMLEKALKLGFAKGV